MKSRCESCDLEEERGSLLRVLAVAAAFGPFRTVEVSIAERGLLGHCGRRLDLTRGVSPVRGLAPGGSAPGRSHRIVSMVEGKVDES